MTYVASPSYSVADPARAANLQQCLQTARKHLDETSRSSDAEKESELIASAVSAGWEENEVRSSLSVVAGPAESDEQMPEKPNLGVVQSSSM